MKLSLREKCSYSELFWSVFSHIRTEYSGNNVGNSEYRHVLRSVCFKWKIYLKFVVHKRMF